ncbi:response regulator transcription factor [Marinibaculum pumilum]|uniref:Response regulator transcription factor n=1 Tax=Marinibaculum pumilum TaxID=1766165 RepID=A0ABV7L9Y8_9PROT
MTARVLIAEDEPNIVESLSFLLKREGLDVTAVLDGEETLRALQADAPDVVILDVMLPSMDGFSILKQIRADPRLKALRVIVLTAKGQAQDRRTAEEIGADAFITKPFSNRDVVERVRRLAGL